MRTCRYCGQQYAIGTYGQHAKTLAHIRGTSKRK